MTYHVKADEGYAVKVPLNCSMAQQGERKDAIRFDRLETARSYASLVRLESARLGWGASARVVEDVGGVDREVPDDSEPLGVAP